MSMTNLEKKQAADLVVANTYARVPICLEKGQGTYVWDIEGNKYTDFVGGVAVCILGHSHPAVAKAVAQQAETLVHVCNLYYTSPMIELAQWLTEKSFADKVFFCNSGAEANEAAIKLARKYFSDKDQSDRHEIITLEGSFHGRTMATLSATGQSKIKKGFAPLLEGFSHVPFGDLDAMKSAITEKTCAIMVEPVLGEGGVIVPKNEYLQGLRALCDEAGILLIFDEIQSGMGRTGKLFAHEHFGVTPDIMTLAKGLANGIPIGAMLAKNSVMDAFVPGAHATTFGGTPLVASAALAVAKTLENEDILAHCTQMGEYFKSALGVLQEKHAVAKEVRGLGLILGLRLGVPGAPVVDACMKKGFLINCTQDSVLRFIPPLIVSKEDIDALISVLDEILLTL